VRAVEVVLLLVVLATTVAALADRLGAPAPSLLVIVGVLVGLVPGIPALVVPPEVISTVVLPPLVFAGALDLSARDLRSVAAPVATLAVGLVAASALAIAVVTHALLPQVGLAAGLVLGAALASTDPVAVAALARQLRLPPRLLALVQAESLFNDATSLVTFTIAVQVVTRGSTPGVPHVLLELLRLAAGGAAVGLLAGAASTELRARAHDPLVATAVALVTPYGAYVGAESFGASGVTAVVVAGVLSGSRLPRVTAPASRLQVASVLGTVVFLLESVVFGIIGFGLPTLVRDLPGGDTGIALPAVVIVAVVVVARVVWVFPTARLPALLRRGSQEAPSSRALAVVAWTGTRGVVPLAAVLSIPLTVDTGAPFPHRDLLLALASTTIAATLVGQGLTLGPLVRRLGVVVDPAGEAEDEARARLALALAASAELSDLLDREAAPAVVVARLQQGLEARIERSRRRLDPDDEGAPTSEPYRRLRRHLLEVETGELLRLRDAGEISERTRRAVQRSLDLEDAGLG